jgi:hypothetical protein
MMSRLRGHDNGKIMFYDIWRNFPAEDLRGDGFKSIIINDLSSAGISLDQLKNYRWILDLKPEGISSDDLSGVYHWFCELGVANDQFRVAFSCVENINALPYPAICLPDRLIYNGNWWLHLDHSHIDWANLLMTHKLVCLMRRPSISRGTLAKRLLSRFDIKELIMSFGTNGSDTSEDIKRMIWPHPYPMIVDQPYADHIGQHRIDHDFFYRAPVNLVVESSSQTDPNVWRSIFITEKTFKSLAWYQFPIWYAVPGLVNEVRKLGFDVFDDLFDNHTYDTTQDPWVRLTQVVLLLKRFCDQDITGLRKQHWNRLAKNADLVREIHTTAISNHTEQLERLIHDN